MALTYLPMFAYLIIWCLLFCKRGRMYSLLFANAVRTLVQKLLVFMFPRLFSEKKVNFENETIRNVLHFMDRPLVGGRTRHPVNWNSCTFWVFGALALSVLCTTVLAFFRYFPIEKSNECKEYDNHFHTLYCFTNSSDLPVNCTNIDNNTEVLCYAIYLDLPIAMGASYGLMSFAGFLITVGVYAAKLWIDKLPLLGNCSPKYCKSLCQCCTTEVCCTLWFIAVFPVGLTVAGIVFAIFKFSFLQEKASRVPETHGELYYNIAYVSMLVFLLPIFFVIIPCLVYCHKDHPTYEYLATEDSPPLDLVNNKTELNRDVH